MANLDLSALQGISSQSLNNQVTGPNQGLAGPSIDQLAKQNKNYGKIVGGITRNANNFLGGSGFGGWGSMAGDAISGLGSAIGNKYGEDFSDDQKATQSAIRKGLAMIPGYGQIIAAATGVVDAIGTATGLNLSNINKDSASRAGVGGTAKFNNMMNMLPGNSMLWGWMGGRTDAFKISEDAKEMESGYSGTLGDMRAGEDLAKKRVLFGRNKINEYLDQARNNDKILAQINETNTMRKQSNYYQDLQHQNMNRYAGQNYLGVTVGKQGIKLMSITEVRAILAAKRNKEDDIEKFQNGGTIGIDTNILPEGALHARKNNLAELNPDLEDATKKGIPVMADDGEQIAEIEHSEIIFRLDVTKQLEELAKDGSEEAMIEAGKLVAEELIENTQDNVGMITEEVQNEK